MARTPSSSLRVLLAASALVWVAGVAAALMGGDPLVIGLWLFSPPLGAVLLGWLPTRLALAAAHRRLRRRIGDPVTPFAATRLAWLLRGGSLGLLAGGAWEASQGYVEAETPRLAVGAAVGLLAAAAFVAGHGWLWRERRRQTAPWRALAALLRVTSFENPAPAARQFDLLRRATDQWLTPAQGRALQDRARPILLGLRDHALTHVEELARQGHGPEALAILGRWRAEAARSPGLFNYLSVTPERFEEIEASLTRMHSALWHERRREADAKIAEAELHLEEGEPGQATVLIDELLRAPEDPDGSWAELRRHAIEVQARARDLLTDAHRSAIAVAEAVTTPAVHPPTATQMLEALAPPDPRTTPAEAGQAREALAYARQHLERSDPESASGWLAHAEYHAANIPGDEGRALRRAIEEVRGRIVLARPRSVAARVAPPPPSGAVDPEAILAAYRSTHEPSAIPPPGRTMWDWLLVASGLLIVLGFFLPWHRADAGTFSGRDLPRVFTHAQEMMGEGRIGPGMLACLEAIILYLALGVGIIAAVTGALTLAVRKPDPLLFRVVRVIVAVLVPGLALFIQRLAVGDSALAHVILMPDPASAWLPAEPRPLLGGTSVGAWLMLVALPALAVAAFARRTRARRGHSPAP